MPLKGYKEDFLLHLIWTGAIKFGGFKLKSGRISPYFINIAEAMRTGRDAVKVADAYVAAIAEIGSDFDYIHGAAYKGIPLSALVAARLSEVHQIDKRWGYDRKEKKAHGVPEEELIIGDLRDGDTVIIVDDVITTGATKVESWSKLTAVRNVKPKGILVAVDREELDAVDKELLEATNLRMYSILKITEIFDFLLNKKIEGLVYVDVKTKKDFEVYFGKYGRMY
jgi:orotate phosphoribosyltransferase